MTRRPLTARELQQCFAPGDVHLIDEGVSFMVENAQYQDQLMTQQSHIHLLDRTYVTQPLPDWACTVVELPRRRKPCGRLCVLAAVFAWIVLFTVSIALLLGAVRLILGEM